MLDHPAAGLLNTLFLFCLSLFAARADVRDQAIGMEKAADFCVVIARVQAEVTQVLYGGGLVGGDALQGLLQQLEVIAVGPGDRQTDRYAATRGRPPPSGCVL